MDQDNSLDIHDFLLNYDSVTKKGDCKDCSKSVVWKKESLASHKRANCSDLGRKQFTDKFPGLKKKQKFSHASSIENLNISSSSAFQTNEITSENVDRAIAKFFILHGKCKF